MSHDTAYRFADLKSCCSETIRSTEAKLKSENGKEIILIAYERK